MEQNPILTNQLSLNSDIPLYSQLVGIIKRSISSGTLKAHIQHIYVKCGVHSRKELIALCGGE